MTEKSQRVRTWRPKTRTGCRTCRIRRIKCDETRPECLKCVSSSRECGGYEIPAPGRTVNLPLLPRNTTQVAIKPGHVSLKALPSVLDPLEIRAFDYFRSNAANNLSGHFSSSVFHHLIPQISHQNPVVLHAMIAVGFIYQTRLRVVQASLPTIRESPIYHQALKQYNRAISNLSTYIKNSTDATPERLTVILIACLLFVCFEMLQGDQAVVISHLVTGLKILFEQTGLINNTNNSSKRIFTIQSSSTSSSAIDELSQVFVRLDADSTMFGRRAPYLCPRSFGRFVGTELDVPAAFESIEEARAHLDTLTSITFSFRGELLKLAEQELVASDDARPDWPRHYCILHASVRKIDIDSDPALYAKRTQILRAFTAWSSALSKLDHSERRQAYLMLRIQYFYPWFILATLNDERASLCDRYGDSFREIVDLVYEYVELTCSHSSPFIFSLEPGITASLYLIGIKCRDPAIRREVIAFLRKAAVQEGLWSRRLFATYCETFMELEEGRTRVLLGLRGDEEVRFVPEEARYSDVVYGMDGTSPGMGRLVCARLACEKDGGLEVEEVGFGIEV